MDGQGGGGGAASVLLERVVVPAAFFSLFLVLMVIAVSLCIAAKNRRRFPVHKTGGVVVTGASSGIGMHVAITLARHGYRVYAGVRTEADADRLRAEGPGDTDLLLPVLLDVTKVDEIAATVDLITADLRSRGLPLVGLINNAGVFFTGPLEFLDLDKTKRLFEVNVWGVIAMTQKFTPLLRLHQGRIINVGSIAGITAPAFYSAYSASKYALEAITDVTRLELAPWRISVSLLQPGFIQTRLYEPSRHDLVTDLTPQQRDMYATQIEFELNKMSNSITRSSSPSEVTHEVLHALSSPFPKTRYLAGTYQGKPIALIRALSYLPDRLQDALKLAPEVRDCLSVRGYSGSITSATAPTSGRSSTRRSHRD